MRVALATTSEGAAAAGARVANAGGNAVDTAIAASLYSMNTEPGVCALAGGGYVSVYQPGEAATTIDGNVAVPGSGGTVDARKGRVETVTMDYGGGITTLAGAGSVAVPGSLAALERAWRDHGTSAWEALLAPSIDAARQGFPLSSAAHYYLRYSGRSIFSRVDESARALHDSSGVLHRPGERIHVPGLADTLTRIARDGAADFYAGETAQRIAAYVGERGGSLTREDLAGYTAIVRPALEVEFDDWSIATNPPPAIGGATLAAMLIELRRQPIRQWTSTATSRLIDVYRRVLDFRKNHLDYSRDLDADTSRLLVAARSGALRNSGSTVHTSAVDESGLATAITMSSGYGSGEMPSGTGLWLNNCLGEIELNRHGLDAGPLGSRLPSNMAPTTARTHGKTLAIGSPGASRITSALCQTIINFMQQGMSLEAAVAHPRAHLEFSNDLESLAYEAGMPIADTLAAQRFEELNMYFGGVGAVLHDRDMGFIAAADPRRTGGVFVSD